jgi:protein TonB
MSLFRYFTAFILSFVTFLILGYVFKTLLDKPILRKNPPSKVIKIALINPVKKTVNSKKVKVSKPSVVVPPLVKKSTKKPIKQVIKKAVVKKTIIKKVLKKAKPKKRPVIHKKKPKKIVKKVKPKKPKYKPKYKPKKHVKKPVKRVVKQPKYVQQQVVEPRVQERYYQPVVKQKVVSPPVVARTTPKVVKRPKPKPTVRARPTGDNGRAKKAFLRNVRSKIIANKKYPKMALRRHVEGSVKIRFDIDQNGYVSNIRFINGKSIFHKSIRKTLEHTFPVGIPPQMRGKLPLSDVSVVLHFNIR